MFETVADAQNAIQQLNGTEFGGRHIDVREDRFAGAPPRQAYSGGYGGGFGRGGFGGGGYGFRAGYGGGGRGGFGGGYGRGGYGGGGGYNDGAGFHGNSHAPAAPNDFTDPASAGGEPSPTIFVSNVPILLSPANV